MDTSDGSHRVPILLLWIAMLCGGREQELTTEASHYRFHPRLLPMQMPGSLRTDGQDIHVLLRGHLADFWMPRAACRSARRLDDPRMRGQQALASLLWRCRVAVDHCRERG